MDTDAPPLSEVVRRAAAICDPAAGDAAVTALVARFEDDDRPARSIEGLPGLLEAALREVDPMGDSPAAAMAAPCAVWLATNVEHAHDRGRVLTEASRSAWDGRPPEHVESWLESQGAAL